MTSSQSLLIALSGEIRWRTRSTRISPPPPGIEPSPAALKSRNDFLQRFVEDFAKMHELARTKTVDVDLRKFAFDVREQNQVPLLRQFRVMPALH